MSIQNFTAPPFNPGHYTPDPKFRYYWWSWNPQYPWWSKSCWKANSIGEAFDVFESEKACGLRYYHNKLIREGDGDFLEVADVPFNPEKLNDTKTVDRDLGKG
jgi:hypothetical protein